MVNLTSTGLLKVGRNSSCDSDVLSLPTELYALTHTIQIRLKPEELIARTEEAWVKGSAREPARHEHENRSLQIPTSYAEPSEAMRPSS
jgi:hypothetical protein